MREDQSPTVVLVEDDPGHARLIERNLRRAHFPYAIVLLRDGQAALDYFWPEREEGPEGPAPTQWRQGPVGPKSGHTDYPISTPTQSRQQNAGRPLPYLVLLDLNLPGCSGVEVLARLKSDACTKHMPVIILTTTDDQHEIEQCYALGCNAYLTKPVAYDQFVEVIQQLGWLLAEIEIPPGAPATDG